MTELPYTRRARIGRETDADIQIEKKWLASVLLDARAFTFGASIKAEDFTHAVHGEIHEAVRALIADGEAGSGGPSPHVDPTRVAARLANSQHLREVGGLAFVERLTDLVPSAANANHFAEDLTKRASRRHLARQLAVIAQRIHDPDADFDDLRDAVGQMTREFERAETTAKPLVRLSDAMVATFRTVEARANKREPFVETPWSLVNNQLGGSKRAEGGFRPGAHIIVGGTGAGKSQWALQIAHHAAMSDPRIAVGYIALELGQVDIGARMLAIDTAKDDDSEWAPMWSTIFHGDFDPDGPEWRRFVAAQERPVAQMRHFYIEEGAANGFDLDDLEAFARRIRSEHNSERPVLIVLDYLQLVGGDARVPLRERIGQASYRCRHLGKKFGIVFLIISSTARQFYSSRDGGSALDRFRDAAQDFEVRPADLWNSDSLVGLGKESGEIEYAADSVSVLIKVGDSGEHIAGERIVAVATAKNRAGVPRWSPLLFNGNRFTQPRPQHAALINDAVSSLGKTTKPAKERPGVSGDVPLERRKYT